MTVFETPKAIARFFPPLTVNSDPESRMIKLKRIKKYFFLCRFPLPLSFLQIFVQEGEV